MICSSKGWPTCSVKFKGANIPLGVLHRSANSMNRGSQALPILPHNPALRSWNPTPCVLRANSLKMFAFYLLLFIFEPTCLDVATAHGDLKTSGISTLQFNFPFLPVVRSFWAEKASFVDQRCNAPQASPWPVADFRTLHRRGGHKNASHWFLS